MTDREELLAIHSALDDALGDSDVTHIEDDDELREEQPVQWAAQKLMEFIRRLPSPIQSGRSNSKAMEFESSVDLSEATKSVASLYAMAGPAATPPNREAAFNAVSEILCGKTICTDAGEWLCPQDADRANEMIAEIVVKVTDLASPHSRPLLCPTENKG